VLAENAQVRDVSVNEESAYLYNADGKRDPFQSFLGVRAGQTGRVTDDPPLLRWDLDRYALLGVVANVSAPVALLVDPEGYTHTVSVGTYVGRNRGRVTSIGSGSVVVTEEHQNPDGAIILNPVTISFSTR
jgi:type IV pilus assembly protein PilP